MSDQVGNQNVGFLMMMLTSSVLEAFALMKYENNSDEKQSEVSDQVPHKSGCTIIEDGLRFEISDLGSRGIVLSV